MCNAFKAIKRVQKHRILHLVGTRERVKVVPHWVQNQFILPFFLRIKNQNQNQVEKSIYWWGIIIEIWVSANVVIGRKSSQDSKNWKKAHNPSSKILQSKMWVCTSMMDFVAIFKPWLMQVRGKTCYGLRGVLSMAGIGGGQCVHCRTLEFARQLACLLAHISSLLILGGGYRGIRYMCRCVCRC